MTAWSYPAAWRLVLLCIPKLMDGTKGEAIDFPRATCLVLPSCVHLHWCRTFFAAFLNFLSLKESIKA